MERQHSSSSWVDTDDEVETTLRRHVDTFNDFSDNIQVFVDGFRDLAMAEVAVGNTDAATVNVRLKTMAYEMQTELGRLNRMIVTANASAAVPEERDRGYVVMSRLLEAQEEITDALYERSVHESGTTRPVPIARPPLARTKSPTSLAAEPTAMYSLPRTRTTNILLSPRLPSRQVVVATISSPVEMPADVAGEEVQNDDGLPEFLAALKPKHGRGEWCRGCNAPTFLVPEHWSDSFHQTLHILRSAVPPPPPAFADGSREARTVDNGRRGYRVFRIAPALYNDRLVRSIREYVDAELGVAETGVRRYERPVYLSATMRRVGAAAASVIGYLETEPVTTGHALGADGRLSPDDRRPVKHGVSRIWVAVGHRRRRVGTNMLDAFRADHELRGCDLAFTTHEIQSGDAFVRHYSAAAARDDEDATVLIYTRSPAWYR